MSKAKLVQKKSNEVEVDTRTLVEKITHAIETDDCYKGSSDDKIISKVYSSATDKQREKIDEIFIRLTGYSLDTLLNHPEQIL